MREMIKIAVDAMGGDGSPKKIIDGIILNHSLSKSNFYKIFGDKNKILPIINGKIPSEYFDEFNLNLSKKTLNYYLKSVSNP